ncbi:hypothetical protein ACFQZ4_38250 [Catellatospora coxensis]
MAAAQQFVAGAALRRPGRTGLPADRAAGPPRLVVGARHRLHRCRRHGRGADRRGGHPGWAPSMVAATWLVSLLHAGFVNLSWLEWRAGDADWRTKG